MNTKSIVIVLLFAVFVTTTASCSEGIGIPQDCGYLALTLSGLVLESDSRQPVAGATVLIEPVSIGPCGDIIAQMPPFSLVTDQDGVFHTQRMVIREDELVNITTSKPTCRTIHLENIYPGDFGHILDNIYSLATDLPDAGTTTPEMIILLDCQ